MLRKTLPRISGASPAQRLPETSTSEAKTPASCASGVRVNLNPFLSTHSLCCSRALSNSRGGRAHAHSCGSQVSDLDRPPLLPVFDQLAGGPMALPLRQEDPTPQAGSAPGLSHGACVACSKSKVRLAR